MRNRHHSLTFLVILSSLSLTFLGCSEDEKPKPKKVASPENFELQSEITGLQVFNTDGQAIPNAQILIGSSPDADFSGNFGQVDEKGHFPLPSGWTRSEMVTIDAPGYVRATYMGLLPIPRRFILKRKPDISFELKGSTSGHPIQHKDGFIDFSLVMSAMTRSELLNFDVGQIISPQEDVITALGMKLPLPSNVSLPRQTENYILGITLEKSAYRLPLSRKGHHRVFAARGRFPFKPVVDGLRKDLDMFELINLFKITGGSLRDVNLTSDQLGLNIPVTDMTFSAKRDFKAPFIDKNQALIAVPVADHDNYLIPTDLKRLNSDQAISFSISSQKPMYLAQILKNKTEFDPSKPGIDRLSASLLPLDEMGSSKLLPLIPNPQVVAKNHFQLPEVSTELSKLLTYAVISDVKVSQTSDGKSQKTAVPAWEIFAPSWATQIILPNWNWNKTSPQTRFEVSFLGSHSDIEKPLGPDLMESASYVTRSSIEY